MSRVSVKPFKRVFLQAMLVVLFILYVSVIAMNHETWLDEAHAWNVARDSSNMSSMFEMAKYEGSPMIWHIVLYPFARSGFPYVTMTFFNILFASLTVVLIAFCSPFRWYQKIMLAFGYFMAYEYGVIARSYAMSCFFIFLVAVMYRRRHEMPYAYVASVFLLSNTNLHSYAISMVLVCIYLFEKFFIYRSNWRSVNVRAILVLCFLVFFVPLVQILPETGSGDVGVNPELGIMRLAVVPTSVFPAFLPVPALDMHFWNTNLFYDDFRVLALLGIPIYLLSLFLLFDKLRLDGFIVYLFSTAGLFLIFSVIYVAGMRHKGFIFLLFFFALWINMTNSRPITYDSLRRWFDGVFRNVGVLSEGRGLRRLAENRKKMCRIFVDVVLVVGLCGGIVAAYYDMSYDFSKSSDTAAYIINEGLMENYFVAFYGAESLKPYFSDGLLYCIGANGQCYNPVYMATEDINFDRSFDEFALDYSGDKDVCVVVSGSAHNIYMESYGCFLLRAFNGSITGEDFYLYDCGAIVR